MSHMEPVIDHIQITSITSPPREYPEYTPSGYYTIFVKDPEGIKHEIVTTVNANRG